MSRNDPPSPPISARVLETVNGNAHPQLTHVAGRHPSERAHKAGRRIAGQSVNVGTGISYRTLESPAERQLRLAPYSLATWRQCPVNRGRTRRQDSGPYPEVELEPAVALHRIHWQQRL
jgi:hypothetical protein